MPLTTTKLPAGPEQTGTTLLRVEMPATPEPAPRRRSRPPEAGGAPRDPKDEALLLDDRAPRLESWLTVMLVSLTLAAIALFVPGPTKPVLYAATGAVLLAGFVMLIVEERRSHARHARHVRHARQAVAERQP